MTSILIPIAHGSEEIEAVTLIDLWVRAGASVTIASCNADGTLLCEMSRGVKIEAQRHIDELTDRTFDLIVLPGGMPGSQHLAESASLINMLKQQQRAKQWLAAICAAPAVVLLPNELLGERATCHPAFQSHLPDKILDAASSVVIDHNFRVVTSQGPGTAMVFALALIELILGSEKRQEIEPPLVRIE